MQRQQEEQMEKIMETVAIAKKKLDEITKIEIKGNERHFGTEFLLLTNCKSFKS